MAQVEQHLHKRHLVGSNHPKHSGYMTGFYAFPLGTLPSSQPNEEAQEEAQNPEPPEEPGEAPETS